MNTDQIILDDGEYYIVLNCNYPAQNAPGFLQRRCSIGPTTPGGYECLGSFDNMPNGTWKTDVTAPYDAETDGDCRVVAIGVSRMEAINALWKARMSVLSTHI